MRVTGIIKEKKGKAISVEIEPPSVEDGIEKVYDTLNPLVKAGIDYINITNHAERIEKNQDGSLSFQIERPGTIGVAGAIKERYRERGIIPVPHIICTGLTKSDIERCDKYSRYKSPALINDGSIDIDVGSSGIFWAFSLVSRSSLNGILPVSVGLLFNPDW